MQISFDWQKHIFCIFTLVGNTLFGSHEHQISIVEKIIIMTTYCMFYFTAIEAKYTHSDTSIPGPGITIAP